MHPFHDNDNERERPVFQRYELAEGPRCPGCNREIHYDDIWSRGLNDIRIVCDDDETTLFVWKA
jgi:hypothetical protein